MGENVFFFLLRLWTNVTLLFPLSRFLTWDETRASIFNDPCLVSMSGLCFIQGKWYSLTNSNITFLCVKGQAVLGWGRSAASLQTSKRDFWPLESPVGCCSGEEAGFIEGLQALAAYLQANNHKMHHFLKILDQSQPDLFEWYQALTFLLKLLEDWVVELINYGVFFKFKGGIFFASASVASSNKSQMTKKCRNRAETCSKKIDWSIIVNKSSDSICSKTRLKDNCWCLTPLIRLLQLPLKVFDISEFV